jgi:two-component system chemotaxis sensor kinase CheA
MTAVMPAPLHRMTARTPAAQAHTKSGGARGFTFGKYREIIIAVALFLLFDLGVLVLNFYTSFQIAQDALGINLAGRQRMLSQRTAKALLAVEAARARGVDAGTTTWTSCRAPCKLFDTSLKGFQNGATVPGGDGKPVYLKAARASARPTSWPRHRPVDTLPAAPGPVLAGAASDERVARKPVDYARANNLRLLGLMNELTTALESVASHRANTLRMVQTVGIALALLNFAFILFKFLRRLRTSDAEIEAANEENREILVSVREGLFLLTPDSRLGSQVSKSAHSLFGSTLAAGRRFLCTAGAAGVGQVADRRTRLCRAAVSPHVKEALVQGINPLSNVEVIGQEPARSGCQRRHLSFHFNRVQEGYAVRHLLVTVQDITARMELETKLMDERQRSQKEFSMLLRAFDADPAMLRQFVAPSRKRGLLEVNDLLRSTSAAQAKQPAEGHQRSLPPVHAIKGDAGTLGLDTLAAQAPRL